MFTGIISSGSTSGSIASGVGVVSGAGGVVSSSSRPRLSSSSSSTVNNTLYDIGHVDEVKGGLAARKTNSP